MRRYKKNGKTVLQFSENIIPERIIFKGNIYQILEVPKEFMINIFELVTVNNRLSDVIILNAWHPNASYKKENEDQKDSDFPPIVQFFCLPEELKNKEIDENLIDKIRCLLKTYNYDNSYWIKWTDIKYKLIEEKLPLIHHEIREVNEMRHYDKEELKKMSLNQLKFKYIVLLMLREIYKYCEYKGISCGDFKNKIVNLLRTELKEYLKWRQNGPTEQESSIRIGESNN